MHSIDDYRASFIAFMAQKVAIKDPISLYEPISYILNLGGKRLRPVLTLMSAEIFGSHYSKALDAALAIEIFHNFSLVHDDIMDAAPLRRGKLTVHEKWDINTGILSGDAMLIKAYQLLENYEGETFRQLVTSFSKTAVQVCEGQQYDMDFEKRDDVTLPEYLKMIQYKTAVLVAAALKMGGIIAGASIESQNSIYEYGKNLGIAFQLQDDYLDAFGNPQNFGKRVGGDIIANKKTYLYLKAIELASPDQKRALLDLYSIQPKDPTDKIKSIKEIFLSSGAAIRIQDEMAVFTQMAFDNLGHLAISNDKKELLRNFGEGLMQRIV
ncbi:MAG: polyprenyl synthetase family protein [Maribacter sp.]|nr:polyprenyl synthetase family protein [Maribacter sp.]